MKKYCLIESDRGDEKQKLYQIKALKAYSEYETAVEVARSRILGGF